MRNIFLEKSYTKCGRETIPRPFSKSQNREYFWVNILKFYIYFLIVCQVENYRKWLKLSCRPLAFTSHKAFLKSKKRSRTSLPVFIFCMIIEEIPISLATTIKWPNFITWLSLLCEILDDMCIVIPC